MNAAQKPLVIHVITSLGGGGAQIEVARVVQELNRNSPFRAMVCCVMGRGEYADDAENGGVEVVVLHEGKRPTAVAAMDLIRFIRKRKPLIVHSHLLRWGTAAAKLAGVPAVLTTEHNLVLSSRGIRVSLDRMNARLADTVIGVSQAVTEDRISSWGIPRERTATVYPGVEVDKILVPVDEAAKRAELGIPNGAKIIGNVARLMPQKAQQYFVEAAARILRDRNDCYFVILGEGPSREMLEACIRRENIGERVKLLGFRSDVHEITQILDVACLSSLTEGLPYVILEAMACGKPVVVTDVGGCREVVADGTTGFVVPSRDPGALAAAVSGLVADPELAREMGQAGRDRVEAVFSARTNLEKLIEVYTSVLNRKRIPFS